MLKKFCKGKAIDLMMIDASLKLRGESMEVYLHTVDLEGLRHQFQHQPRILKQSCWI